jgi:hypothetical protein
VTGGETVLKLTVSPPFTSRKYGLYPIKTPGCCKSALVVVGINMLAFTATYSSLVGEPEKTTT